MRDPDELHDVLLALVVARPRHEWAEHFRALASAGRSFEVHGPNRTDALWAPTERRAEVEALFPGARLVPDHPLPPGLVGAFDAAAAEEAAVTRSWASRRLRARHSRRPRRHHRAIAVLGDHRPRDPSGTRVRGERALRAGAGRPVRPPPAGPHTRLHPRAQAGRGPSDQLGGVGEFLQSWWHAAPGTHLRRAGLAEVIEQLQGSEWPAGSGSGSWPSGSSRIVPNGSTICACRGRWWGPTVRARPGGRG